jgi:hypothetical protein
MTNVSRSSAGLQTKLDGDVLVFARRKRAVGNGVADASEQLVIEKSPEADDVAAFELIMCGVDAIGADDHPAVRCRQLNHDPPLTSIVTPLR